MRSEASPIAGAELRRYEAKRSEQLPAGAQCELPVMKLRRTERIAPNGSKTLSRLLFGAGMKPLS